MEKIDILFFGLNEMTTKLKIPVIRSSKVAFKSFIIVFIMASMMVYKTRILDESDLIKEFEDQVTLSQHDDNEPNNGPNFDHLKNLR